MRFGIVGITMDNFLYIFCFCWVFGHKWRHMGTFSPDKCYLEELDEYPTGYICHKCIYCDCVEKFPYKAEL